MMGCGDCSVCCTVCVVPEYDKKAGEHCIKDEGGCQVYGNHPQVCQDFECAYYQGGSNIELRPDRCGVMFLKRNERIFCAIFNPDKPPTALAKGQVRSLTEQGYSVVMMKIGEQPHIISAPDHDPHEIYKEYTGILKQHGNL